MFNDLGERKSENIWKVAVLGDIGFSSWHNRFVSNIRIRKIQMYKTVRMLLSVVVSLGLLLAACSASTPASDTITFAPTIVPTTTATPLPLPYTWDESVFSELGYEAYIWKETGVNSYLQIVAKPGRVYAVSGVTSFKWAPSGDMLIYLKGKEVWLLSIVFKDSNPNYHSVFTGLYVSDLNNCTFASDTSALYCKFSTTTPH